MTANVNINDIVGATQVERKAYLSPGNYKLQVLNLRFVTPRNGGSAFVAEFKVLESDNPKHQPGSGASWYQKMNDSAGGAIWYFLCRTFRVQDPQRIDDQTKNQLGALLQNAQSQVVDLSGSTLTVQCEARVIPTKAGKPFTLHTYAVWVPEEGWTASPTPAEPVMPQTLEGAPVAAPGAVPPPTVAPAQAPPPYQAPVPAPGAGFVPPGGYGQQ